MRNVVAQSRTRQSRLKPSKLPQGQQPDVASKGVEPSPSHGTRPPASRDLARDATSLQPGKRRRDAVSADQPLPAKRVRLTRTKPQTGRHLVGVRKTDHAAVSATGPLRRSARLKTPSAPSRESQTEVGERPGLTRKPWVEDKQLEQTVEQPKPFKCEDALPLEPVECQEQAPPAKELRKRQIGSDSDDRHQLKRARLTRNNLALFNKMGRKKGTNKMPASAPPDSTVESSTTTKTTSTTASGFAMQARKNGMLHPRSSKPPQNLHEFRDTLAQSRATASPPESAFNDFVDRVEGAENEATMMVEVSGELLKKYPKGYKRVFNQAFTGFPKDAGFNNGLSNPQPDFVEGPEMQGYLPFPVDEHINGAALYKGNPLSVTLPHLAGEWKGHGKDMELARLQSAYDGAALVYGRNQALSYLGKPDPPGHAEIMTFTTDGTNLNMYAHYAAESEDGTLEYHQCPIKSINLTDSYEGFKVGRKGLRNAQDYAREQSYALENQLKEHWRRRRDALQPIAEGASLPVEDEDEAGYEVMEQPYQPTPPASSKPERQKASSSHSASPRSLPPVNCYDGGGGSSAQKRKASLSQGSSHESSRSKGKGYAEWHAESGRSGGRIT